MATLEEIKSALNAHASKSDERERKAEEERSRHAEWRGRFGKTVETIATEVAALGRRVDTLERTHGETDLRARAANDHAADLEGRVVASMASLTKRLDAQDAELSDVSRETRAQSTTLTRIEGVLGFLKWAIPIAVGVAPVLVGLVYWLATHTK